MGAIARFEQAFLALCKQRPLSRSLVFTGAGLVLGAGTCVAPMRRDGEGAETLDLSGEDRVLALLAVAFSAPVKAALLGKLRHASKLWGRATKASRKSIWSSCACQSSKPGNRRSGSSSPIS
ncbi:MAG: hypothetical protein WBV25_03560 [Methylocella sp.]